jgi:glucosamine 6-phosphate synthetase-like amidotransferase/phosphosugar isomerase protein
MHTIEAYENDIKSQSEFLKIFKKQKPLSEKQQKNTIFTGSGDSLSSAMLAEVFSNFSVRYMDPLDLLKNKSLSKNRSVYFVSISGNTISNIKVAKNPIVDLPKLRIKQYFYNLQMRMFLLQVVSAF